MECDACGEEIVETLENPEGVFVRIRIKKRDYNICMDCIAEGSTRISDYMEALDTQLGKYGRLE